MTRSPMAVARTALDTARETLLISSSKYSRYDVTLHQHFALTDDVPPVVES